MSFILNEDTGNVEYTDDVSGDGSLFTPSVPDVQEPVSEPVSDAGSDGSLSQELLEGDSEVVSVTSEEAGDTIVQYVVYADTASSLGFPSTNSLDYLEDVVRGYPSYYSYAAYRTSDDYSQAMVLFIARDASGSGSIITFEDCDVIEIIYNRSGTGYSTVVERAYSHEDSISCTIDSSSIAYTNVLPGYGTFDVESVSKERSGLLTCVLIGAVVFFSLKRLLGGARHV